MGLQETFSLDSEPGTLSWVQVPHEAQLCYVLCGESGMSAPVLTFSLRQGQGKGHVFGYAFVISRLLLNLSSDIVSFPLKLWHCAAKNQLGCAN